MRTANHDCAYVRQRAGGIRSTARRKTMDARGTTAVNHRTEEPQRDVLKESKVNIRL